MRQILPVAILLAGLALLAPFGSLLWMFVGNYAVGFGIELTIWTLALGTISTVLGMVAVIWSLTTLLRRRNS
jgi:hypothetical protein